MGILSAFHFAEQLDKDTYQAEKGVLSLQNWDVQAGGTIKLDGEWDFYPNELIAPDPNKDVFENYRSSHTFIPVPEAWNQYMAKEPTPYGVGTYRLRIDVPEDHRYGVRLNTIRDASRVYINGIEMGSAGVPSESDEDYRYDFKKYTVIEESKAKNLDIVIQVANKEYIRGGIVSSIDFGTVEYLLAKHDKTRFIDALLIAGYLLFGGIYGASHVQNKRKYRYEIFFSLYCFTQAIYVSTVNERWISLLFPSITPIEQVELQMFSHCLAILFFLLFVYYFFKPLNNKRTVITLSTVMAFQAAVFLVSRLFINLFLYIPFPIVQLVISFTTLLCYFHIFIILVRAFLQKTDESKYVLMSMVSFLAYGFLLAIELLFEIEVGSAGLILFLIMAMSLSLLMSYRSTKAFQKVEELSEELIVYDRLKDEFLAKTSHELSTPLHVILNLSQSLMEGTLGPLKKEQQESVVLMNTVGKRLANLVKDLLYVSKIKKGEVPIVPQVMNIAIMEDVIAEMTYLIPETKQVKLVSQLSSDLPFIYADEQKLKQVLFNLIHNAIKFTDVGTITISAKIIAEQMHVSIEDTGRGIQKEHDELIFTTFYQEESSKLGEANGLGLGLSIAKQIVEEAGERIWVTSTIGKGSCFTFTIPLATEEQLLERMETEKMIPAQINKLAIPPVACEYPQRLAGDKPHTILLVDDEFANLKVLMNQIHSLGYSLIAVDSGEKALEIVDSEKVDLLILDLMMPHMTGYEVCKTVRARYDLLELPIIMLTAAGQFTDLVASFQLGANDYVQKPSDQEELKVRIESLLLMKKSAQDALKNELGYFYAQITPHFLYNTLNTIIGLSYTDQEKTREALEHLATYFRAKLDFQKQYSFVPIEDEIELVEAYLAIEKMRFGERLTIEYEIDDTIETYIPALTFQPLVENAVQHGLSKKSEGGTLRFSVQEEKTDIKIVIEDDGVGIPQEKQNDLFRNKNEGLGLINPFNKISLIKGASFKLNSEEGKGTKITIRFPKITDSEYLNAL